MPTEVDAGPAELHEDDRLTASIFEGFRYRAAHARGLEKYIHTFPGFLVVTGFLSVGSCALAFAVVPISNPLTDPNVWQCALSCSTVWVWLTVFFVVQLLEDMLYKPLEQRMPIKNFFVMWFTQAFFTGSMLVLLPSIWANPAPMSGVFGALLGVIMNAIIVFLVFIPRLGTAAGVHGATCAMTRRSPIYTLQRASLGVLLFFLLGVVLLIVMLVVSAALQELRIWYVSALILTLTRSLYLRVLGGLAETLRRDARVLGDTLAMITAGMANAIVVGSAATWLVTLTFVSVDFAMIAASAVSLSDAELCGHRVGNVLLLRMRTCFRHVCIRRRPITSIVLDMTQEELEKAKSDMVAFLIGSELAEIVVVMNFPLCWLVVHISPSASGFSGNGTSDFGLRVPDNAWVSLGNIFVLFCFEVISIALLKEILHRCAGFDIGLHLRKVLSCYGPLLATMSAWVIVTTFCFTMIHCGLDFSLKWDYL